MNKEEMKEYQRKWYLKNKDKHRERGASNYIKNREHRLRKGRENYVKNKEGILKKHKEYRVANREELNKKHRAYNKIYLEKNREKINKAKKLRYINNKELHFSDQIKRKYGITIAEYNSMFISQNGMCAICYKKEKNRRLATDHCHSTGKVRGLLCFSCNSALGQFSDNIDNLKNAIKYLSK